MMLIRTKLSAVDRQVIARRLGAVAPALAPASKSQIDKILRPFFLNWGSARTASMHEAAAVVAEYISTLKGLPLFAIAQSLERWKQGRVTPEEVFVDKIDRAFAPSATFVRIIAENVARPYWREAQDMKMLLDARVEAPPMSEEERKAAAGRVEEMRLEAHARLAAIEEAERRRTDEEQRAIDLSAIRATRVARETEFRRAGLEPVYSDASRTCVVSLPFLLASGWTVEESPRGDRTLVAPPRVPNDGEKALP